ncbi:MAG TPA: hypothetical protein VF070_02895 [Streptosporangiaceae bacterium]
MRGRACSAIAANAIVVLAVVSAVIATPAGAARAGTAVAGTAVAGTAPAASPDWTIQNSPDVTIPGGQIDSMSCVSATSCMAVGSFLNRNGITDTLAEAWNGTSWRKQTTPNPAADTVPAAAPALTGVSCPVAGFCEAVGAYTNGLTGAILAQSWNGTAWTSQSVPSPSGSTSVVLRTVSCTSPTFCEAVGFSDSNSGTTPLAETWNGTAWSVQSVPVPAGEIIAILGGVSCVSATFCEAIGGSPTFAEMWDGTSWTPQAMPGGGGSVSCVSASFCVAVGGGGATGSAIWNGSSWTAQPIPAPAGATSASIRAVSCSSAQACEAVGSYSTSVSTTAGPSLAEMWNGTSWTVQSTPNPAGAAETTLTAVSCAATATCEAGGDFGHTTQNPALEAVAEGWNGSSWTLQAAVTPHGAVPNALNSVSCVSASFCEAVGTATDSSANTISLAEAWNGTSWKIQPTPEPAQSSGGVKALMNGVSCVTANFCEAVGFSAAAQAAATWVWNGTLWTTQPVPASSGLKSVSCTSAAFCMAVAIDGGTDSWNGSTWSQSAAIPSLTFVTSVSCVSASFCEAIGTGSSAAQEAAVWNGTAWSLQATPLPADGNDIGLRAVSCVAADSCTAVGFYTQNNTFAQLTLAEHWDGSAWVVQSTPNPPGSIGNGLFGVWCTSASFCASVGEQQDPSTLADLTLVQVWNGASWTTRSSANRTRNDLDVLNSVWCGGGNRCTAAGIGADRGSVNATLVETGG